MGGIKLSDHLRVDICLVMYAKDICLCYMHDYIVFHKDVQVCIHCYLYTYTVCWGMKDSSSCVDPHRQL